MIAAAGASIIPVMVSMKSIIAITIATNASVAVAAKPVIAVATAAGGPIVPVTISHAFMARRVTRGAQLAGLASVFLHFVAGRGAGSTWAAAPHSCAARAVSLCVADRG
jgi:hypothetical protein